MRQPDLIHTDMLDKLGDFYDGTGTVKAPAKTQSLSGHESRAYAAVSGLENIPLRLALKKRAAGGEVKRPDGTYVVAPYEATLSGWYEGITEEMRLTVDSTDYEILLSQSDSEAKTTHLDLQIIR